jgi:hypothetical protein
LAIQDASRVRAGQDITGQSGAVCRKPLMPVKRHFCVLYVRA